MDDIGLFEIIVILGLVGIAVYFLVKGFQWLTGCGPSCSASNAVTKAVCKAVSAVGNAAGQAVQKMEGPTCTNPTPVQPQCNLSWSQKTWNWLGNLFGLKGGVNAMCKFYNPQSPTPTPPASSTGVTPGAGQACGCARAVVSCCAGWCCQNYSIGG